MSLIDWTKLPSLTALRAFEAAARSGSFSAAARSLNVTHAAVAQQVRILEDHFGLALVRRSPRGVALTADGQTLAASLSNAFAAIADGVETLRDRHRSRPVQVTTTNHFAQAVLFPRMASFWQAHPDTAVSFSPSDRAVDIQTEGFDLAIRAGSGDWPGLQVTPLLDCPTIACAAPALIDNPATDWTRVPWLISGDSTWQYDALRQSGIDPEAIETVDMGNASLEVGAAEEGLGLVLNAEINLLPQLAAGTLRQAPIPIANVSSFFVVAPPWPPRPAVRDFIDWLLQTYRDRSSSAQRSGGST